MVKYGVMDRNGAFSMDVVSVFVIILEMITIIRNQKAMIDCIIMRSRRMIFPLDMTSVYVHIKIIELRIFTHIDLYYDR